MRLLTYLYNKAKNEKYFEQNAPPSLLPPYPPHGVELRGAESLQSPTLTGPPT